MNLRLRLHNRVNESKLSLCNLNDLFDQTSPNLVLELLDPVGTSISKAISCHLS